jgi:hemolysin III
MYHGERFNGISHLVGALMAAGGAAVLITFASLFGDVWKIVGTSIYGAGMILVFTASTLYHSTPGPWKSLLRKCDHISIYFMIAGTYTPFCLVSLRGPWGWWLFGIVWSLALVGVLFEFTLAHRTRLPSILLYFFMALLAVAALKPLALALSWNGLLWLTLGGFLYVAGFFFYFFDEKVPHFHGIWHLFVMGGSTCQYLCILLYVVNKH